jgi:hypothetical protein
MWMTRSGIPGILIRRVSCPITTKKDFPCKGIFFRILYWF